VEEQLFVNDKEQQQLQASCWSHDGKLLLYGLRSSTGDSDVWALPLDGDRKPRLILSHASGAQLSPDDHWLAYVSTESGPGEVYVVPFGNGQGKWQVSAKGGIAPAWSKDGKELYFVQPPFTIIAVPVQNSEGALHFGAPETLVGNWTTPNYLFYSVSPDGKKVLLERVSQEVSQSVTVITNFAAELKK
jgi:Tol biopolymer transport system component